MYEEQRLISIGFPLDAALSLCHSLRKEGTLKEFVEEQEKAYRMMVKEYVKEALG